VLKSLSIHDKLLIIALSIEESGKSPFSAEDLVVEAWKKYPEPFGLAGYNDKDGKPLYPNSNRVLAEIMGSKPLRKNGLVRKVGSKIYQLTEAGRSRAKSLVAVPSEGEPTKWALSREHVAFILRLFESKAASKFREGQKEDISFFEACGFWGISAASDAKQLWSRFAEIDSILKSAGDAFRGKKEVSMRHGAEAFSINDLRALMELHCFLRERFKTEISHIEGRIHEWQK
jgi:hypothetical protein